MNSDLLSIHCSDESKLWKVGYDLDGQSDDATLVCPRCYRQTNNHFKLHDNALSKVFICEGCDAVAFVGLYPPYLSNFVLKAQTDTGQIYEIEVDWYESQLIYFAKHNDSGRLNIFCPWCYRECDISEACDEHPMLNCFCGAKAVIDIPAEYDITNLTKYDEKLPPELSWILYGTYYNLTGHPNHTFYSAELLWIDKVMPEFMGSFKPVQKPSQEKLCKFISDLEYHQDDESYFELLEETGFKLGDWRLPPEDKPGIEMIDYLGIDCHSFNINKPKSRLGCPFELNAAERIYVRVCDKYGGSSMIWYWED